MWDGEQTQGGGCTVQGPFTCLHPPQFGGSSHYLAGETQPGESIITDGSMRVLLGAGKMAGPEDSYSPGLPLPICTSLCIHPPQLHIPVESPSFLPAAWEVATSTPGYLYMALTPYFPVSQWDIDSHRGSFVQTKRSLSLSLSLSFFYLHLCGR